MRKTIKNRKNIDAIEVLEILFTFSCFTLCWFYLILKGLTQ